MKLCCTLMLALGLMLAVATPARAADGPAVTGVVETPNAVFFQPAAYPSVVWYFPKSEVTMTMVPPQAPGGTFWRAAVVFKRVTADDLALLPPAWAGKSMVPYIIRPTTECQLNRQPEMRFVVQEVKALNRDVSAANPPACRFSFRLPTIWSDDLKQRMDELKSSDTLIKRSLLLELHTDATIAWADVFAAVAAALEDGATPDGGPIDPELTLAEARALVEAALASPELAAAAAAMTLAETEAFVDAALAALFTTSTAGTLRLVLIAPTGSVVYHQELFQRAM